MIRLATVLWALRTTAVIASGLIIGISASASELQDLRLGITHKRTRLVYQLDQITPYDIKYDESSVSISFDALTYRGALIDQVANTASGMIKRFSCEKQGGKVVFQIEATQPFYLRYFDLVKPERLVVDLYPKTPKTSISVPPSQASTKVEEPVAIVPKKKSAVDEKPAVIPTVVVKDSASADTVKAPITTAEEQQAETPAKPLIPPSGKTFNWLYIIFPVAIVFLVVIGIIALRRAAKRTDAIEKELQTEEAWTYKGKKFKQLLEAKKEPLDLSRSTPEEHIEATIEELAKRESQTEIEKPAEEILKTADDQSAGPEEVIIESEKLKTEEDELTIDSKEESSEVSEEITASSEEKPLPEEISEQPEIISAEGKTDENVKSPATEEFAEIDKVENEDISADEESLEEGEVEIMNVEGNEESQPKETKVEPPVVINEWIRHEIVEDDTPVFQLEEGMLYWPIHILDGERTGRILIVDDEPEIVRTLEEFLDREDYDIVGVTDGDSAWEKYREWRPDLIITDVVMPGISGVDLVKKIRERNGRGKVIFMSGKTDRDSVSKVFSEELADGLYEFFRKPISLEQIGGRVRDYFSSAQEILPLNLNSPREFDSRLGHLGPYQLVPLQRYLWDKIFEVSSSLLGRRIETYYISDRMEPPINYMRRVGCQEREDYCIANICFGSNPLCAAEKIRGELEVMRQILQEFRKEYQENISIQANKETKPKSSKKRKKVIEPASSTADKSEEDNNPPERRVTPKEDTTRNR